MSVVIIPKDRTLTKEQYRLLRSMARKIYSEYKPQLERAHLDAMIYGTGIIYIRPGTEYVGKIERV